MKISALVNLYFYTRDPSLTMISKQGQIIDEVAPGLFLVETYEWITGGPYSMELMELAELRHALFYESQEAMKDCAKYGPARLYAPFRDGDDK